MANELVFLETELLKLKRLKVWGKIVTTTLTVLFASILVACFNFSFTLKDAKAGADQRQAEINKNTTNENEPASLEIEKLMLERFKVWKEIITVGISVLSGSLLITYINNKFQNRQLEQQKILRQAELELQEKKEQAELKLQNAKAADERRQSEMKYLGDFITYALADDHEKRLRFADYFATLTISQELQEKWKDYRNGIIKTIKDLDEKKIELGIAQESGGKDTGVKRKLEAEVARLQAQLSPLPEYLSYDKAGRLLDARGRPKNHTKNEFEVQKDSKVIYDKATGLTWQQSGSEKYMSYDETSNYIRKLNQEGFAGYKDWRLPTLEDAITLLKPEKTDNGLYIDPLFEKKQAWIWTSDLYGASRAWVVNFPHGYCSTTSGFYDGNAVRAVR